jgi:hypothetical protein
MARSLRVVAPSGILTRERCGVERRRLGRGETREVGEEKGEDGEARRRREV